VCLQSNGCHAPAMSQPSSDDSGEAGGEFLGNLGFGTRDGKSFDFPKRQSHKGVPTRHPRPQMQNNASSWNRFILPSATGRERQHNALEVEMDLLQAFLVIFFKLN